MSKAIVAPLWVGLLHDLGEQFTQTKPSNSLRCVIVQTVEGHSWKQRSIKHYRELSS